MESWEARQEAETKEAAERRCYPEESDDDLEPSWPYNPEDYGRRY